MALEGIVRRDLSSRSGDLPPPSYLLRSGRTSSDSSPLASELTSLAPNVSSDPGLLCRPPFPDPAAQLGPLLVDEAGREIKMHFDHGTTTLGF